MFKDYSKGIKYVSEKKKKEKQNKKQKHVHTHPPTPWSFSHTHTPPTIFLPRWKDLPAAAPEVQKASYGTTCSEGAAVGASPGWAAGQPGSEVRPPGWEAPASSEEVAAEKAAQEGRPEASGVQEEELALKKVISRC